jgi:osmotically-inducible protein OsmY
MTTSAPADELSQQVASALEADPRLHAHPIRVSAGDSGIRLEGEVDSIGTKRMAAALAQRVAGDRPVVDAMRLACPGQTSDDTTIRDALAHALLHQRELHNCTVRQHNRHRGRAELLQEAHDDWPCGEIELAVSGGEIALSGKVISLSHKRMIEALAWRTPGCCNVVDRLLVVPAEDDNDDELADAIRLVLEMDPLLAHADQVGIRSERGVVTLAGVLGRDDEKHLAERDAWSVWGVVDVRNRIEVRPG